MLSGAREGGDPSYTPSVRLGTPTYPHYSRGSGCPPRRRVRAPFYMRVGRNWGGMSSSTKEADIQFLVGRLRDFYQSANSYILR
jgi:hypothetical protein